MRLNEKIAREMVNLGLASVLITGGALGVENYYDSQRSPEERNDYYRQTFKGRLPLYIGGLFGGVFLMGTAPVVAGRPVEILPYFRRKKQTQENK